MKEKRREDRLLCAELVELVYREEAGRQHHLFVNLEDICSSGACLVSEVQIPDETRVTVFYEHGRFVGTVRYCVYREIGFLLGVEFDPGCQWSQEHFRPDHLLDPRLIGASVPWHDRRAESR